MSDEIIETQEPTPSRRPRAARVPVPPQVADDPMARKTYVLRKEQRIGGVVLPVGASCELTESQANRLRNLGKI